MPVYTNSLLRNMKYDCVGFDPRTDCDIDISRWMYGQGLEQ